MSREELKMTYGRDLCNVPSARNHLMFLIRKEIDYANGLTPDKRKNKRCEIVERSVRGSLKSAHVLYWIDEITEHISAFDSNNVLFCETELFLFIAVTDSAAVTDAILVKPEWDSEHHKCYLCIGSERHEIEDIVAHSVGKFIVDATGE